MFFFPIFDSPVTIRNWGLWRARGIFFFLDWVGFERGGGLTGFQEGINVSRVGGVEIGREDKNLNLTVWNEKSEGAPFANPPPPPKTPRTSYECERERKVWEGCASDIRFVGGGDRANGWRG